MAQAAWETEVGDPVHGDSDTARAQGPGPRAAGPESERWAALLNPGPAHVAKAASLSHSEAANARLGR